MVRDPTNIREVESAARATAEAKLAAQRTADADLEWVMSDARGRRFVWRVLGESGPYRDSMTGNSYTFYNLGVQRIARWLLEELHRVCLPLKHKMELEQSDK